MINNNDDILLTFIGEAEDRLLDIESGILALESYGSDIDEELIHSIFRDAHSVKAGANLMGLKNVEVLSHRLENILDKIRTKDISPNKSIVSVMLQSVDKINDLMNNLSSSNDEDISYELARLDRVVAKSS